MPRGRFDDEGIDNYEPSESEDEFTEKEKELIKKVRNRKKVYSDSEDEVYGVGPNDEEDDEDDDKSDLALSDVEGHEDDDLPDVRAWGKDKKRFYSTDYVDPDYGGFQGKDAQLAELEEKEATNLQKLLAQQLDDDDFALDFSTKKTEEDKKQTEEIIKTDISKLTNRQKLQLLQKDSPEFFGLTADFEVKLSMVKDYLLPILGMYKKGQIPDCKAVDFVQTHYTLIMNYATNIYMYLLLKSSKVNIENHPIIKRLYQYRQLLSQLQPLYEEAIKPQIELILENANDNEASKRDKRRQKKTLKFLETFVKKPEQSRKNKNHSVEDMEQPSKKIKVDQIVDTLDKRDIEPHNFESDSSSDEEEEEKGDSQEAIEATTEADKRAITYQMAKNKGLTPYRKKELRNPRVKHRLKYRKAVIRRKGAVREPRREITRYGGEISGIKTSVTKSIKIKT